ncbi:MAG: replication and repair protein recF [Gemmatimonadetes bacterium]|nr:replication and repair protein recF [Gemmatimonadota bacterium]
MTVATAARLRSLALRDFRNFERLELELPAEGLVLVGENGQGKTNLLEAIVYMELLRSMRGARDADLVRFGAEGFHLSAQMETERAHEMRVGYARGAKRKRVQVDGGDTPRLSDAFGTLPSVLVSPTDVELIAGAPSARRRYLDILLALTSHGYLSALQHYRAALLRRNAALRDASRGSRGEEHVRVWEAPLAEHGAVLWRARLEWTERVSSRFAELCAAIGERSPVAMRYAASMATMTDPRSALEAALEEKRALDIRRCLTHVGPHRDDLHVSLDGRELRSFGSAGQQRSAAIALRILEAETLRELRGGAPLLLLDDPFAELDVRRSTRILELLAAEGLGQTILAVPRAGDIPRELSALERLRVVDGRLLPWEDA